MIDEVKLMQRLESKRLNAAQLARDCRFHGHRVDAALHEFSIAVYDDLILSIRDFQLAPAPPPARPSRIKLLFRSLFCARPR
jgi:hypothetical protein